MSSFIVLIAYISVASVVIADLHIPEHSVLQELVDLHVTECGDQFNLSNATRTRLIQTDNIATLEVTEDIKCFMKCLIDKANFIEHDALHEDKFHAVLNAYGQEEAKMRAKFDTCKNYYQTSDDCAPLWNMYLCFDGHITYPDDN